MRAVAGLMGVLCACVPTTVMTRRVALTPIPGAPSTLTGGSGADLTVRMLTGTPQPRASGGALAIPIAQPELGAVLRIAERTFTSVKLTLAPAVFGVSSPPEAPVVPANNVAFDASIGFGQDLVIFKQLGVNLSTELGVRGVWLTVEAVFGGRNQLVLMASGRAGGALYFDAGALRLFAGSIVGLGTYNDLDGTYTTPSCVLCVPDETGALAAVLVGTAGGGLRWQARPEVAVVAQGWASFTANATQLPVVASLGVRVGDFTVFRH